MPASAELEHLLRLRLVVARCGEMDAARWWNTRGMLGPYGAKALERGLPQTHRFARARVVFAVARRRCRELFDPPGCATLWQLPATIEDAFETHWQEWIEEMPRWQPLFDDLEVPGDDLTATLRQHGLITGNEVAALGKLRRSAAGRAVLVPGYFRHDRASMSLLAAGFALGEPGKPAIPYIRLEE